MSFFNKLGKTVGKAAEQAKFEAEKMARGTKIGSEVGALNRQIQEAIAAIGAKVVELHEVGQIHVPELADQVAGIKELQAQVAEKEAELAAAKAAKLEEGEAMGEAEEAAKAECPECGAEFRLRHQKDQKKYCSKKCYRHRRTNECAHCGSQFDAFDVGNRYCSDRCRKDGTRAVRRARWAGADV